MFETLLYNGRDICLLKIHVMRLKNSVAELGFSIEDTDYRGAIERVVQANGLQNAPARINIFCPVDAPPSPAGMAETPLRPIITAMPYTQNLQRTFRLCLASTPAQHPWFAHKSMNYMFHWHEHRRAVKKGYDDAILFQQGHILHETTTAALLFSDGKSFCVPLGGDKLPSLALETARTVIPIRECTVRAHTISHFSHVYVLNSLMGMRPVVEAMHHSFEPDETTCNLVTEAVCGGT